MSLSCKLLFTLVMVCLVTVPLATHSQQLNQVRIDSIKTALPSLDDRAKLDMTYKLASLYRKHNLDSSLRYGEMCSSIARELGDRLMEAEAITIMGIACVHARKIEQSSAYHLEALAIYRELGLRSKEASSLIKIGHNYRYQNDFQNALKHMLESLKIIEQTQDSSDLTGYYNDIAITYATSGNLEYAERYFLKCIPVSEATNDLEGLFLAYLGLGNISSMKGNGELGMEYYQKCVPIAKEMEDPSMLSQAYGSLGIGYRMMGNCDLALSFFHKQLKIDRQNGWSEGVKTGYGMLAECFIDTEKYLEALLALDTAEQFVHDETFDFDMMELYRLRSEALKGQGNFEEALEVLSKYIEVLDTVYSAESAEKIAELNVQFETEKKESQLAMQELELSNQVLLSNRQTKRMWLAIGGMALLLVIASSLFYLVNRLRKQKAIIERSSQEKELLMGEIHHRVKNNLQMISSLLNLQQRGIEEGAAKTAIKEGSGRVHAMALVHNLLYQDENLSSIEIAEYLERLCSQITSNLSDHRTITVEPNIDDVRLDVDTAVPIGLIVNELITNSIKYAKCKDLTIKLDLTLNGDNIQLSCTDNCEVTKEALHKLENKASFGMRMIRSLTDQLKGELNIKSENGLRFEFLFARFKVYA